MTANPSPDDVHVVRNDEAHRYEARVGGRVVAFSEFRLVADRVVFLHTETADEFEGRGIGSRLVAEAVADVRGRGLRMTPKCPFVAAWVARHPEAGDLVAWPPASVASP